MVECRAESHSPERHACCRAWAGHSVTTSLSPWPSHPLPIVSLLNLLGTRAPSSAVSLALICLDHGGEGAGAALLDGLQAALVDDQGPATRGQVLAALLCLSRTGAPRQRVFAEALLAGLERAAGEGAGTEPLARRAGPMLDALLPLLPLVYQDRALEAARNLRARALRACCALAPALEAAPDPLARALSRRTLAVAQALLMGGWAPWLRGDGEALPVRSWLQVSGIAAMPATRRPGGRSFGQTWAATATPQHALSCMYVGRRLSPPRHPPPIPPAAGRKLRDVQPYESSRGLVTDLEARHMPANLRASFLAMMPTAPPNAGLAELPGSGDNSPLHIDPWRLIDTGWKPGPAPTGSAPWSVPAAAQPPPPPPAWLDGCIRRERVTEDQR